MGDAQNRELFDAGVQSSPANQIPEPTGFSEPPQPSGPRRFLEPTPSLQPPRDAEPASLDGAPRDAAPAPKPHFVAAAEPTAFHAVSEHDALAEEQSQRPARRRRQPEGEAGAQASAPLQLVETLAETLDGSADDDLPRRSRPRRRRAAPVENVPLMLVETQSKEQPDTPPVP